MHGDRDGDRHTGGPEGPTRHLPAFLVAAAAIALLVQTPPTIALGVLHGQSTAWIVLKVVLAAASALTLLAAARRPGPTVAVVAGLSLAMLFIPPQLGPPPLALGFALIAALVWAAPVWAVASAGAAWLAGVTLVEFLAPQHAGPRIIAGTVALAVCTGIGVTIRTKTARAARRTQELAERARAAEQAERAAIARELHDVLSHSLSQISVQSGMGLHLFDRDPAQAREALSNIRRLAGSGLAEARGVLAALRGEDAPLSPAPQLAELPELISAHRSLGLDIVFDDRIAIPDRTSGAGRMNGEVRTSGAGRTPPAGPIQATAVRIVREALTNVLRHSAADRALVRLERDGDRLVVLIEDDGVGPGVPAEQGGPVEQGGTASQGGSASGGPTSARHAPSGGGLRSMRERAELAGGTLDIASGAAGRGTRITARLPWTQDPTAGRAANPAADRMDEEKPI
ncbi:histidine kinase [Brevibacterium sp. 50QC2O2]|uniref:sensor histidine kinase n=1 Tax=unclassified Brevibacterium TaxID=2614124 RepID=UPI00211C5A62|nr:MULTISPECIES: histidine kinase [unclassified Brevibacterium]MCQ9368778.1 histidine kinase [Brevibacterium sp. 91QC2O2]MCQ9388577.1 histidine kinase [Brevibacterium sp. 50QC2O2]